MNSHDLRVGDIIYEYSWDEYFLGRIEKIEGYKLWAYFCVDTIRTLPKTLDEFEALKKDDSLCFLNIKPATKKLMLNKNKRIKIVR